MEMVSAELETWNSTFLSGLLFLAKEIFLSQGFYYGRVFWLLPRSDELVLFAPQRELRFP